LLIGLELLLLMLLLSNTINIKIGILLMMINELVIQQLPAHLMNLLMVLLLLL